MNLRELKELAHGVQALNETDLDFQEKMGRRFILCNAEVDVDENLAALLELAEKYPQNIVESLRLIQFLRIDKSAALPFVLQQIDPTITTKAGPRATIPLAERLLRDAACRTLRTFRSPKAAERILQFIRSTDDAHLIWCAVNALSNRTLPKHFEQFAAIADHVAESSKGPDTSSSDHRYLDLLVHSDPQKAIPLLDDLRTRHPKYAARIAHIFERNDHALELTKAISLYHTSQDIEGELQAAIAVLQKIAKSEDIAKLKYRPNLPAEMNERLVSVIRLKGGDSSVYPFVEAYYQEHVQGKKAHNHLTCVEAFVQIGDRRAIPYLREIFKTTERKSDASEAIGKLLLNRGAHQKQNNLLLDEHIPLFFEKIHRKSHATSPGKYCSKTRMLPSNGSYVMAPCYR